jgi:hypothetical protein
VVVLAVLLAGCTTRLAPPASPAEPVAVYLLDHGRHASLVLPNGDGGLVRYAFGDWAYYARNRTGVWHGLRALLWPTPAALGRRALPGPVAAWRVRRSVAVVIRELHVLEVAGGRVAALRRRLAGRFAAAARHHDNRLYDLTFARLDETYWLGDNSNQRVAAWLAELGVVVSGGGLRSAWSVARAAQGGA